MLTASGSNFRVGPVNFYRAIQNRTPEGIASAVALTFMGARAESWPTNRLAGMTAFFSQIGYKPTSEWKEEHVFWDPLGSSALPGNSAPGRAAIAEIGQPSNRLSELSIPAPTNPVPSEAVFPGRRQGQVAPGPRPAGGFADWLITPRNPVVHPQHRQPGLGLAAGARHHPRAGRYSRRQPAEQSRAAGLPGEGNGRRPLRPQAPLPVDPQLRRPTSFPRCPGSTLTEAEANFASYSLRRLDAEVLIDAINKITGTSDLYTSPIPEPFTYIPEGMPAVAIADGSITSPFLALFGRSARATGMENERNNKPTPAQWLLPAQFDRHPAQAGTRPQSPGHPRLRPQAA